MVSQDESKKERRQQAADVTCLVRMCVCKFSVASSCLKILCGKFGKCVFADFVWQVWLGVLVKVELRPGCRWSSGWS